MKFSTKTSYGLRAVFLLARNHKKGSISLPIIAKIENISLKYLEQIFSGLKKAGLVVSVKGSSGGYALAKNPSEISTLDVVRALEGEFAPFHCMAKEGKMYCSSNCHCGASEILSKLQDSIYQTLDNIKLTNL